MFLEVRRYKLTLITITFSYSFYRCYNLYMLAPNDFHANPTCSQFFEACDFISSLILYLLYLHLNVSDNKLVQSILCMITISQSSMHG